MTGRAGVTLSSRDYAGKCQDNMGACATLRALPSLHVHLGLVAAVNINGFALQSIVLDGNRGAGTRSREGQRRRVCAVCCVLETSDGGESNRALL